MRHQHELPLTRVMELRPNHEAPPRNHHGITSWPMRHHHEISPRDSWNYVLNHTKIMSHQPSINLSCIPIPCQHLQPTIQSGSIQRSYQTHQLQPINYLIHAKSLNSCFNIVIQPDMWPSPKNREEKST